MKRCRVPVPLGLLLVCGLAVGCATLAVLRLRPVALRQPERVAPRVPGRLYRPRVGRLPMIWKELFIEPGFRLNWVGRLVAALAVLLSLAPAVYHISKLLDELQGRTRVPTVLFYPGEPVGTNSLRFMGLTSLHSPPSYRVKIYG